MELFSSLVAVGFVGRDLRLQLLTSDLYYITVRKFHILALPRPRDKDVTLTFTSTSHHVSIDGVYKNFDSGADGRDVLQDINLEVARGEFLSLIGPSGCGKSTLLRLIGGLMEPTSGKIEIGGRTPAKAQADKALGFVFQEPSLLPWRTVMDNVRLPLEVNRQNNPDNARSVSELLDLVGLGSYADYYPSQISGGMQQRTALARALASGASLLLMDEPFGALDEITRATMTYELLRIWSADRKSVVFVTHSISEAVTLSDRVAVMSSRPGRIVEVVEIGLRRPRARSMEREPAFRLYSEWLHDLLWQGNLNG